METKSRVIEEKDIGAERLKEKVLEEKDIVAPVEHRRVVEQRKPREYFDLLVSPIVIWKVYLIFQGMSASVRR